MASRRFRACESCAAGLDSDQRYCLNCGARAGDRSRELIGLRRRAAAAPGAKASPAPAPAAGAAAFAGGSLRVPAPRISALLVLAFLGFGTLLGSAAGSGSGRLAAEVPPRLTLLVPAARKGARSGGAVSETAQPPQVESQSTPEAQGEAGSSSPSKAGTPVDGKRTGEAGESGGKQGAGEPKAGSRAASKLPAFKHVFLIVLSDQPYASVFGPESKARYLARTLEKKGELLLRYDAVAHEQLANGIALISGQGPTAQTAANCPSYEALTPGGQGADGQVLGSGCVYPASTMTIGGQLAGRHLRWRAYVEGIDEPGSAAGACAHPTLGAADPTGQAGTYANFRDPFVYFESVVSSASCSSDVVGLGSLRGDLASGSRTPSLLYIVPDRCHDAGPVACAPGAPAGPADADGFLESVVPPILASKAYRDSGLLVITTDEAPSSGEYGDSSSCCGQPEYPDLPAVEGRGRGGGAVGALLLSPLVPPGRTSSEPYNHFSLLRTIEDAFKLKHLGYAGLPAVKPFSPALFSVPATG